MKCPYCHANDCLVRKGFFSRKTGARLRIGRFRCRLCARRSSEQTGRLSMRHRRPELNRLVYLMLISGVSQRRTARLLGTTQKTVARKLVRLSAFAVSFQAERLQRMPRLQTSVFDEMETFEHTRCKPVAIAVAVDERSRRLISAKVAKMPAKGKLAAISRKKYGWRPDQRAKALQSILRKVAQVSVPNPTIKSDQCPRYPVHVRRILPFATHQTFKGRRACIAGLGELKVGGWDPLFSLNHTCAMFRDNLKRLSRRTWCTTKRVDRLQCLVNLYVCAHNDMIDQKERRRGKLPLLPAFYAETA